MSIFDPKRLTDSFIRKLQAKQPKKLSDIIDAWSSEDDPSDLIQIFHPTISGIAKDIVAKHKKLSPHVPAKEKTFITGHDSAGRILSTVKVSFPAGKRDFDALARKKMTSLRKMLATEGASFYADLLAPAFKTHSWKRLQFLAATPDADAFWKTAASWYDEPTPVRIGQHELSIKVHSEES